MAEKKPLCLYDGVQEELRAGDTLPGAGAAPGGVNPVFVGSWSGTQWLPTNDFVKIGLNSISIDTRNGWDAANNWWVAPENGIYHIEMKYRFADGMPVGRSCGIGAGTSLGDDPAFFWAPTGSDTFNGQNAYRHGILNQRLMPLYTGNKVMLYMLVNDDWGNRNVVAAEMTIRKTDNLPS